LNPGLAFGLATRAPQVSLGGPFFLPMRSYTAIAIEKLAHLVQHAKSEQACIAAASELLSR